MNSEAPRFRWPLLLGIAGFAAGFFGPMIFVPESNQGPMVGIFLSGPAGVVLGFLLLGLCTIAGVSARAQRRLLGVAALAIVLTVLVLVQPEPALRGYVMELEVESCATPLAAEARIIDHWTKRIAEVTWSAAREGWQADMHRKLLEAPGVILQVRVVDRKSVWEKRKPWNRGALFATEGRNTPEVTAFHDAQGSCPDYPAGRTFRAYEEYALNGPIRPPREWPPGELEQFIDAAPISAVPVQFDRLVPRHGP